VVEVAAIASVVAAVFAVLGFFHGVVRRWPRLSVEWRPYVGAEVSRDLEPYLEAQVEVANVGGSSARHVRVVFELDGKTLEEQTATTIAPDDAWRWGVYLRDPDQATMRSDRTLDVHGRTLSACVSYRRARFLPAARRCGTFRW
jgi:hypothetical protein